MPRAIYEVQTIDRDTGSENWVRVEAKGKHHARELVAAMGEATGDVRLVEVLEDSGEPPPRVVTEDRRFSVDLTHRTTGRVRIVDVDAADEADAAQKALASSDGSELVSSVISLGAASKFSRPADMKRMPKNAISCPKCSEPAFGGRGCLVVGLVILCFPIGLLFLLIKPTYECKSCGFKFRV